MYLMRFLATIARTLGSTMMVQDQLDRLMCVKSTDASAARRDLGFAPLSFEEGIRNSGAPHTL